MSAFLKDTIDQRVVFVSSSEQGGNRFRWVLEVIIHRDDPFPTRRRDAANSRRVLAKVAAQAQATHLWMPSGNLAYGAPRFGLAAIVDQDDFVVEPSLAHGCVQSTAQLGQGGAAAVNRNDDRSVETVRCIENGHI